MISNEDFAAIAALDLDAIKVKLMHKKAGTGWSAERVNAIEREYRRFLYLMKKFPNEATAPVVDVDTFWHYHILDTMKYAADCQKVFGHFLHHFPYVGMRGKEDEEALKRMGERMRTIYEETFQEDYLAGVAAAEARPRTALSAGVNASAAYGMRPATDKALCTRAISKAAYCTVTSAAAAEPAYCTMTSAAAAEPAYCTVTSAAEAEPAYCTVTSAAAAEPAYCTVTSAAAAEPAYCTVTSAAAAEPAYCTVTSAAEAEPAYCTVTSAAAAEAAYCTRAIAEAAYCTVSQGAPDCGKKTADSAHKRDADCEGRQFTLPEQRAGFYLERPRLPSA